MSKSLTTNALRSVGLKALQDAGYSVTRKTGVGRGPNQRLEVQKGGSKLDVAIRTSQDGWTAFVLRKDHTWQTLDEVDAVLVVAVDDVQVENPKTASVWLIPAKDVLVRFNEMLEYRVQKGDVLRSGIGVWTCLRARDIGLPYSAGSGLADDHDPIAREQPIVLGAKPTSRAPRNAPMVPKVEDALQSLADALGVNAARLTITISGVGKPVSVVRVFGTKGCLN